MLNRWLTRIFLLPFALVYGAAVSVRNALYEVGLLKSTSFNIPTISVGNLSIGGAGKTPHIEYLIELLGPYIPVATLSGGYKRKTKGFRLVDYRSNVQHVGDEPLQFKRKYPSIAVAVSESRTLGVPKILSLHPEVRTVLLDDAFQHRSITPGLNILLTEYDRPFHEDFLMPAGRLREWPQAYKRADIIVVSKAPLDESEVDRTNFLKALPHTPSQAVFFSYYQYGACYHIFQAERRVHLHRHMTVILICAIANTQYLLEYLEDQVDAVYTMPFEDHHYFTEHNMSQLNLMYQHAEGEPLIITTEKDATRLQAHAQFIRDRQLPIYVLPVHVAFHFGEGPEFNRRIQDFLLNFTV